MLLQRRGGTKINQLKSINWSIIGKYHCQIFVLRTKMFQYNYIFMKTIVSPNKMEFPIYIKLKEIHFRVTHLTLFGFGRYQHNYWRFSHIFFSSPPQLDVLGNETTGVIYEYTIPGLINKETYDFKVHINP